MFSEEYGMRESKFIAKETSKSQVNVHIKIYSEVKNIDNNILFSLPFLFILILFTYHKM